MKEKMREIIGQYEKVHKSGLNLKYFSDFKSFDDGFKQTSMFKEKKLIILKDLLSNNDFRDKFLEKVKDLLKTNEIVLIYQESDFSKNSSLFKTLKKKVEAQEFEILQGQKLRSWIIKEFKKYNREVSFEIVEELISFVGNDLWAMSNEIKKLVSYRKGKIELADIKLLIRSKIETDIFKTIDAISDKNKKQALDLIHKHIEKGDSPLYLFSMINYQFRNLLIVKDLIDKCKPYDLIIKKTGLHPFVVKKSYSQSNKFDLSELKKIYQKIFQIDLEIKTGKVDPETALDLLIATI
jgi:DNA polymerase-3 subunit delta